MQPSRLLCFYASLSLLALLLPARRACADNSTNPSTPAAAPPRRQETIRSAQLTNQDIVALTKAGLSSSVIVDEISVSTCQFDTSATALANLKSSGVENSVLAAMIRCHPADVLHNQPYVWIGTTEERISEGSHTTLTTRDSNRDSSGGVLGGLSVATSHNKTTSQTHSEYFDVARELQQRCQGLVITSKLSDADYAVTVERYHAHHLLTQRNSFSVFRARDNNLILSDKTTWLKNATADICNAIMQDIGTIDPTAERK